MPRAESRTIKTSGNTADLATTSAPLPHLLGQLPQRAGGCQVSAGCVDSSSELPVRCPSRYRRPALPLPSGVTAVGCQLPFRPSTWPALFGTAFIQSFHTKYANHNIKRIKARPLHNIHSKLAYVQMATPGRLRSRPKVPQLKTTSTATSARPATQSCGHQMLWGAAPPPPLRLCIRGWAGCKAGRATHGEQRSEGGPRLRAWPQACAQAPQQAQVAQRGSIGGSVAAATSSITSRNKTASFGT